jgi:hypothetical protein
MILLLLCTPVVVLEHRKVSLLFNFETKYLGISLGVLIKHENIIASMTGQKQRALPMLNDDTDIYIAYLPLAHIFELCCGWLISFFIL